MIASASDIQAIRAVAINVAEEVVNPFIDDVEKQDVLPVIGADLYFEIERDKENEKYNDFLRGGTFTGCNGETLYTRGLIAAIAYLAYARLLIFGDIQYTAFGAVLKTGQLSTKPGEADKIRTADSAKKIGMDILRTAAAYSAAKFGSTCCGSKRVTRPRFISISKTTL